MNQKPTKPQKEKLSYSDWANIAIAITTIASLIIGVCQYVKTVNREYEQKRPIVAISESGIAADSTTGRFQTQLKIKNYGATPALNSVFSIVCCSKDTRTGEWRLVSSENPRLSNSLVSGKELNLKMNPILPGPAATYYIRVAMSYNDSYSKKEYFENSYFAWEWVDLRFNAKQLRELNTVEAVKLDRFIAGNNP